MNLENMCQVKEAKHKVHVLWLHLYQLSRIGKSIDTESKLMASGVGRRENEEWWFNEDSFFLVWWNVLELEMVYNIVNVLKGH